MLCKYIELIIHYKSINNVLTVDKVHHNYELWMPRSHTIDVIFIEKCFHLLDVKSRRNFQWVCLHWLGKTDCGYFSNPNNRPPIQWNLNSICWSLNCTLEQVNFFSSRVDILEVNSSHAPWWPLRRLRAKWEGLLTWAKGNKPSTPCLLLCEPRAVFDGVQCLEWETWL